MDSLIYVATSILFFCYYAWPCVSLFLICNTNSHRMSEPENVLLIVSRYYSKHFHVLRTSEAKWRNWSTSYHWISFVWTSRTLKCTVCILKGFQQVSFPRTQVLTKSFRLFKHGIHINQIWKMQARYILIKLGCVEKHRRRIGDSCRYEGRDVSIELRSKGKHTIHIYDVICLEV